ncbi:hypothetical protein G4D82_09465 [Flavobacterium sp. CYK-4]|uniref:hypothetical protein n=1 Tax=Flavobacterium lotistagni TaxID=2709660 RepID=UPI001408F11C|nr:hypothetical protein [Flavobacterium lotistagni]NHM07447.1 hypothetical protein [Flavobacterium lotistagni]
MMKPKNTVLILLIIVNSMVLLGQLWPEGAPPFARLINIVFLLSSMTFFILTLKKNKNLN